MIKVVVTGGAGFIGSNLGASLLKKGDHHVLLYDNLSRAGTEKNLAWLQDVGSPHLEVVIGDVRDFGRLQEAMQGADLVYHLASQVAVTSSVDNPREDFEVNAWGTFNVLEAARLNGCHPIVLYASTNKVYGGMEEIAIREGHDRYEYAPPCMGISEQQPLDFHSPYGCSKGAGDQYVRDYHRIYGLRTVVLRQSCIYGPRQFGNEDQGWVAHFVIQSYLDRTLTIYGDGKQVRDILYVDDLLRAFELAIQNIEITQGQVYNIGGGLENAISLLELIRLLKRALGREVRYDFDDWRPGDQRVYISDISKAARDLGWTPSISKEEGVHRLLSWTQDNMDLFRKA
jgi:CDP-paratose 2-epimerase